MESQRSKRETPVPSQDASIGRIPLASGAHPIAARASLPPQHDALPARIERYRLESVVGQGAYGRVYKARDEETGEIVAMKEFLRQEGRPDSFLRELGILFDLTHPNIIACRSLSMAGPFRYIVCEYMEAGSLRDLLRRGDTPTRTLLELLLQVAEGVAFAHARDVIHRDLKPENVLLTRAGGALVAKVSDFGVSTLGSTRDHQSSIGSPAYMAPEQFYERYDARVDVYALGVMTYEILCDRRPFSGGLAQLMTAHLRREPAYPVWLPKMFTRVLRRSLAKSPDRRYASVRELIDDLALAMETEGAALDEERWPLTVTGARAIAAVGHDLVVNAPSGLHRFDPRGRRMHVAQTADQLVSAGSWLAVARDRVVTVTSPHAERLTLPLPAEAKLSLSAEGALAYVHAGACHLVERGERHELLAASEGVSAACFAGAASTLIYATAEANGRHSTVHIGGARRSVPGHVAALVGHGERYEVIATTTGPRPRTFAISAQNVIELDVACRTVSCERDVYIAVTLEGDLAMLSPATNHVARTRWAEGIVSVCAAEGRMWWLTEDGRIGHTAG
jgi:hypothetical protein